MKKLAIVLLVITVVLTVVACKAKPADTNSGISSVPNIESEIESTVISEGDFFTQNGTESEFEITESQALELFENQESIDTESKENDSSKKEDASSENVSDSSLADGSSEENIESENSSEEVGSDKTESKNDSSESAASSKPTASKSKFDKDGDGWTDGWK